MCWLRRQTYRLTHKCKCTKRSNNDARKCYCAQVKTNSQENKILETAAFFLPTISTYFSTSTVIQFHCNSISRMTTERSSHSGKPQNTSVDNTKLSLFLNLNTDSSLPLTAQLNLRSKISSEDCADPTGLASTRSSKAVLHTFTQKKDISTGKI